MQEGKKKLGDREVIRNITYNGVAVISPKEVITYDRRCKSFDPPVMMRGREKLIGNHQEKKT